MIQAQKLSLVIVKDFVLAINIPFCKQNVYIIAHNPYTLLYWIWVIYDPIIYLKLRWSLPMYRYASVDCELWPAWTIQEISFHTFHIKAQVKTREWNNICITFFRLWKRFSMVMSTTNQQSPLLFRCDL